MRDDYDDTLLDKPLQDTEDDALTALMKKAETDPTAMGMLGLRYKTGDGVPKNFDKALYWFEKSGTSIGLYGAGTLCYEQGDYKKAEALLVRGTMTEDTDALPYIHEWLGKMYFEGKSAEGVPNYKNACKHLEKAIRLNPSQGGKNAVMLARAYEQDGRKVQAIHWYQKAIEDYGQTECEDALWQLYLTGAGGEELRKIAETRLSGHQAEPEADDVQEPENENLEETAKIEYPEAFISGMRALLEYEIKYIREYPKWEEKPVPQKKGLIFKNTREIEQVEKENAEVRRMHQSLRDEHDKKVRSLITQKSELEARYGTLPEFFFEKPFDVEETIDWQKKCNHFNFADKLTSMEKYTEWLGTFESSFSGNYLTGDVYFCLYDDDGNFIDGKTEPENGIHLYKKGEKHYRKCKQKDFLPFLKSGRYVSLYCDWDYLKEHENDTFELSYLMSVVSHTELDRINSYYDYRNYIHKDFIPEEVLNSYGGMMAEGTRLFTSCYKNYYEYVRNTTVGSSDDEVCSIAQAKENYDICKPGSYESAHVRIVGAEQKYTKRAVIVWHEKRVIAVMVPYEPLTQCIMEIHYNKPTKNADSRMGERVRRMSFKQLNNVDSLFGATMHYAAKVLGNKMKPLDVTEPKPEGISDDLWREWLRMRISNS